MVASKTKPVPDSIKGLLGDNRYADLTITSGDRKWRVHKAVICTRCEFFEKAVDNRFKESASSTLELKEDPPNAIAAMIRYLYTDDFDESIHKHDQDDKWAPLPMSIHVHAIADKYGLLQLADLAVVKFKSLLQDTKSQKRGFYESIRRAYSTDTDNMEPFRKCIMDCAMQRGKMLICTTKFQEVAAQVPAFAAALVAETFRIDKRDEFQQDISLSDEWQKKVYRCPGCERRFSAGWSPVAPVRTAYCPHCGHGEHKDDWKRHVKKSSGLVQWSSGAVPEYSTRRQRQTSRTSQ